MAGNKGFGKLAIKYGRSTEGVTAPKYLEKKQAAKSPVTIGLTMGGHVRTYGHAKTTSTGGNKSGMSKAAK